MAKYKITITLDLDFQPFFDEIPNGLFRVDENENKEETRNYYEQEMIYKCLNEPYLSALKKNMDALANNPKDGKYKYLKHHLESEIQTAKQISENILIEKLKI